MKEEEPDSAEGRDVYRLHPEFWTRYVDKLRRLLDVAEVEPTTRLALGAVPIIEFSYNWVPFSKRERVGLTRFQRTDDVEIPVYRIFHEETGEPGVRITPPTLPEGVAAYMNSSASTTLE